MIPKLRKKAKSQKKQENNISPPKKRGRPRKDDMQKDDMQKDENDHKADEEFVIFVKPHLTHFDEQEIAPGARFSSIVPEEINPTPDWMLGEESNNHYTNRQRRMLENAWLQESQELQELWMTYISARKANSYELEENVENYDQQDEKYEEEEEESINTNDNEINYEKYHYKEKIDDFYKSGWDNLDDGAQKILNDHRDDILNARNYQEQVQFVFTLIYSPKRSDKRGYETIANLFGVKKGTIFNILKRIKFSKKRIGRPPLLNNVETLFFAKKIQYDWENHIPQTLSHISNWIYVSFNKIVNNNTLAHMIARTEIAKIIPAYPSESKRIEVPLELIEEYYEELHQLLLARIPPAFLLNVDESGFQEWADKKMEKVIVPLDVEDTSTNIGVDRTTRRATMIGCVAANGTKLKPIVIISRKTLEKALREAGYNDDNVIIVHQENGFNTALIFDYWADQILFPEIERRRILYKYQGPCILLFDGCTCHNSDFFLDECTFRDVIPVQEPANSSDQVQVLDLGIFGIQKKIMNSLDKDEELTPVVNQIINIVDSWIKATTPSNITSAFKQAGFVYEDDEAYEYVMNCDITKARAVRGIEHNPNTYSPKANKKFRVKSF